MRLCIAVGLAAFSGVVTAGCEMESDVKTPARTTEAKKSPEMATGNRRDVRAMVRTFMEHRVAGRGAERFVATENLDDFGTHGQLGPMYPRPRLEGFEIVFIDGPLGGPSYEVGVELFFARGSYGDTLFVTFDGNRYLVTGGRPGLVGP